MRVLNPRRRAGKSPSIFASRSLFGLFKENLRGQWTTLTTPFAPDDEFDEEGMRGNIRQIRFLGTQGGGCTWGMGVKGSADR